MITDYKLIPFLPVPMNRVKVGMSASPNLKQIKSKVGSLNNHSHR